VPQVLRHGGEFFMEIGADQGAAVMQLFTSDDGNEQTFDRVELLQDYSGRDRVLYAKMMT
jgi:methylase of polypeptide subunit release factors